LGSTSNIPTAEYQSVMHKDEQDPVPVAYPRVAAGLEQEKQGRNRDLDPQLVWRGKDERDWSELVVQAPPLYIQDKDPSEGPDRRPAAPFANPRAAGPEARGNRSTCSRISTACPTTVPGPSSTATTPTGAIA